MKTVNKPRQLTIKRSKWLRGKSEEGDSCLLREPDGQMCCLGFYARHLRYTRAEISDVATPIGLVCHLGYEERDKKRWNGLIMDTGAGNSTLCNNLMETNDRSDLSEKKRESSIKRLFKKINVDVTFVD